MTTRTPEVVAWIEGYLTREAGRRVELTRHQRSILEGIQRGDRLVLLAPRKTVGRAALMRALGAYLEEQGERILQLGRQLG